MIAYASLISSNLDKNVQFSIKCKFIYILLILPCLLLFKYSIILLLHVLNVSISKIDA